MASVTKLDETALCRVTKVGSNFQKKTHYVSQISRKKHNVTN